MSFADDTMYFSRKGDMQMGSVEIHKIHFEKFIEAIDQCKGNVWLITPEGDKLNLKSKLCQVIGLTRLVSGGMIDEAKIFCEDPEDDSLLFRFNLYGDKVLSENKTAEN